MNSHPNPDSAVIENAVRPLRLQISASASNMNHAATTVASICRRTRHPVRARVLVNGGKLPGSFQAGNLNVEFIRSDGPDCSDLHEWWPVGINQLATANSDALHDGFSRDEPDVGIVMVAQAGATAAGRADVEWGDTRSRMLDWRGGRMPWQDAGVCGFQAWLRELTGWEELRQELEIRERDRGRMAAFVIHQAGTGVRREALPDELLDAGFAMEPVIGADPDYPFGVRASVALLLDLFGWPANRASMARALGHRWAWLDFLTRTEDSHALFCEDQVSWTVEEQTLRGICNSLGQGPWMLESEAGTAPDRDGGDHDRCYCLSREAAMLLLGLDLKNAGPLATGGTPLAGLQRLELDGGKAVPVSAFRSNQRSHSGAGDIPGPRILIAICSCHGNTRQRQAVRKSWFPQAVPGIKASFVVGQGGSGEVEQDTIQVDAADEPGQNAMKIKAYFRHALEKEDFEWLFLCEDDTYVAVDRLAGLTDGKADMVITAAKLQGGGGAGCLLARGTVAAIAGDESCNPPGTGISAIIRMASAAGAVAKCSQHLSPKISEVPQWENDQVSCHPVPDRMMEVIHAMRTTAPLALVEAEHPIWRDHVLLHPEGLFRRKSNQDTGRWFWDGERKHLTLAWFTYPPETFEIGEEGKARALPKELEAVSYPELESRPEHAKVVFARAIERSGNQLVIPIHLWAGGRSIIR
ncbi:MAG: hypothetical protein WCK77_17860 [Verrucomicrobiota bacterium]